MTELIKKLDKLATNLEKYIQIQESKNSQWIGPDHACQILGFPITESGSHRRKLKQLEKAGFLKKVRNSKPKQYWRKEVEDVSYNFSRGRVKL